MNRIGLVHYWGSDGKPNFYRQIVTRTVNVMRSENMSVKSVGNWTYADFGPIRTSAENMTDQVGIKYEGL